MAIQNIEVTASAYAYPLLIKQLLHGSMATAADQEIVYGDRRLCYREFFRRLGRLANALARVGIEPGSTVAMMDWDSHRYLECYFAVPMMGAVLQTVNIRLSPEQILYTLNHAQADVVLLNAEFAPLLESIRDQLETVKRVILISDNAVVDMASLAIPHVGEYEQLLDAESADYDFPDFDENTRATTFYTTGTTGLPKGVYFSHRQLVLHTLAAAAHLGSAPEHGRLDRRDVYMPITPMFHVHAWGLPYVATMLGLKQVYPGRYAPESLLRLVRDEKVTFSHCVPTVLHMLLSSPLAKGADLSGWKVIVGGAALSKGLAAQVMSYGIDIFIGYGMSETCPILTIARVPDDLGHADPELQIDHRIKAGYPIPLVDLRTVDGDMRDAPRDGRSGGEIVARAPWLTQGYLFNRQTSEELWAGGYLHTGDIGVIDARGCLQVTDRLKDVIKTGGEWVSSLELENIISQHPAISEVAVVGVKDDKWSERPLALVVLKHGLEVGADEIRAHVATFAAAGHISRYAIPDQIRFVASLPRTSVGKFDKKIIREQLANWAAINGSSR